MGTCKKSEYIQSIKNETEANNAKTNKYETDNTSDRRRFTGKSVVVTGAAGIITALLQLYIFENPENNEEPHIYAMIDDPYNDVKNM